MSDKIFIGRVDVKQMNGVNGSFEKISISLGPQDFEKLQSLRNGKGWVNLLFKESGSTGKKYLEVDQYVPTRPSGLENTLTPPPGFMPPGPEAPDEDLPF